MKKKMGAILAAGVMSCAMVASIGMSGCFAQIDEFEMPEGGYDGSAVEITFANTMGQKLLDILDPALERFKELYPNITVKVDSSNKDYDSLEDKIATQLTGGKQPNVAFCYSDHVALYNESKAVLPLSDYFLPGCEYDDMTVTNSKGTESLGLTKEQVADYVEDFYKEGSVYGDGKVYTLPFAKSTEVLYYNETFFEDNHLTVPKTWAEMEATCKTIRGMDSVGNGSYPLGYDSEANWFITMCEQYGSGYTSATGDHFLFNNNTNKAFVQMLKRWYDAGYFTTKETYGSYTSYLFTETAADKPKCFMSIGSTGGASYQDSTIIDGKEAFHVGVAPMPQIKQSTDPDAADYDANYKPKSILQGPSVCIFKKKNPQEVLASWLLVKFLTTEVRFQASYSETSGYMPVTYSTLNSETYQDFLNESSLTARTAATCAELIEAKAFYTSPAFNGSSKARERVGILMKTVLNGSSTIDDAFAKALKECNDYVG